MHRPSRQFTGRLMDAMDEGILDARAVADMALNWLSEADVEQMVFRNDLAESIGLGIEEEE